MIFNVTEQTARVFERVYQIEAPDAEQAIERLEEMETDERADRLFREHTLRQNTEIIGADEASA